MQMGIFKELSCSESPHNAYQEFHSPSNSALAHKPTTFLDGSKGLNALHQLLGLHRTGPLGPISSIGAVFVSIDFEYQTRGSRRCHEVGISKFDTRSAIRSHENFPEKIKTNTFTIEDLIESKARRCYRRTDSGQSSKRPASASLTKIRNMIEEEIFVHNWNRRQIVLVGQNIRRELNLLREIGLDLVGEYNPGLLAVLDTRSIAAELGLDVNDDEKSFGLGQVLEQLGISFKSSDLQNAGSNSSLTLRALLGLGVSTADREDGVSYLERKLEIFAKVSLGLPPHGPSQAAEGKDQTSNERQDVDRKGKSPVRMGDHMEVQVTV